MTIKKKLGLIGFGVIGSYLFRKIAEEGSMEVGFIWEVDRKKTESVDPSFLLSSFDDFDKRPVDLVVEVAAADVVRELGLRILKKSDLLIFSLTSLADNEFRHEMETTGKSYETRIYIPHGAILGLDGIRDGRKVIEKVQITTIKNPKSLGLKEKGMAQAEVVYEGSTRGACERFPRNVNVHASVALAGLGFDKTFSKVIADPSTNSMAHVIEVTGQGLCWRIEIESLPAGEISGVYTLESAYQTVKRLFTEEIGWQLT